LTDPAAPSLTDRLTMTREAIRASMAEDKPKGPGAVLEAILLKLLDALLRLLADFKAGRLAPLPPGDAAPAGAEEAGGRSCPAPGALDAPAARRGGMLARAWGLVWPRAFGVRWAVDAGGAAGGRAVASPRLVSRRERRRTATDYAVAYPSPSRFAGPSLSLKGERDSICTIRAAQVRGAHGSRRRLPRANGEAGPAAYPSPSRIAPHFCQQKREPVAGPSLSLRDPQGERDSMFGGRKGPFSKIGFRGGGDGRASRSRMKTTGQLPGGVGAVPRLRPRCGGKKGRRRLPAPPKEPRNSPEGRAQ
jgi:hypothetical protein